MLRLIFNITAEIFGVTTNYLCSSEGVHIFVYTKKSMSWAILHKQAGHFQQFPVTEKGRLCDTAIRIYAKHLTPQKGGEASDRLKVRGMEPKYERKQLPHPAFLVLLHALLNDLLRAGSEDEQIHRFPPTQMCTGSS